MQEGWIMRNKTVGGKNEIHMMNKQKETCIFSEIKKNLFYLYAKVIPDCNVGNVSIYHDEGFNRQRKSHQYYMQKWLNKTA